MTEASNARPSISTNARVGAATLAVGSFATLALTHTSLPLAPLRVLTLCTADDR